MVGRTEEEAQKGLIEQFDMNESQARAAWLFYRAFPKTAHSMYFRRYGDWLGDTILGEPRPETVLKIN